MFLSYFLTRAFAHVSRLFPDRKSEIAAAVPIVAPALAEPIIKPFNISDFDPNKAKFLNNGLWGDVYDLQDGTVLKIAYGSSTCVGDASIKIETEHRTLKTVTEETDMSDIVPRVIGHGEISASDEFLYKSGFRHWLRTTKMDGIQISAADIAEADEKDVVKIGLSIGHTLGRLHQTMMAVPHPYLTTDTSPFSDIRSEIKPDSLLDACAKILIKEYQSIPSEIMSCPAHGDFNISNLLFKGYDVSAVLDFAEAGICFPEKDASDILKDCPSLTEPLILAYELTTGFKLNPRRLMLGLAENALYATVIAEKSGDEDAALANTNLLLSYLNQMGHRVTRRPFPHIEPM